jgi:hypothetical protein
LKSEVNVAAWESRKEPSEEAISVIEKVLSEPTESVQCPYYGKTCLSARGVEIHIYKTSKCKLAKSKENKISKS